ncbi:hypothetical protein HZB96_02780 [Candidatus Gottesmanbacteria bacterium]|nr:hypothetical protein [Candidatus Gottesmanbacteria bacterium]MBI5452748.1 hypothetical protein [Candidatus Gottesmanbacteria bacterium]
MKKSKDYLNFIRQYEILIASSAVVLLVFILSYVLLLPNFSRANTIFREQRTLSGRLDNLKKKDSALVALDYQYYKDNFPKISKVLPENKDYVSLFSTFDDLERKTGVSIVRTDFALGVVSTDSGRLTRSPTSLAFLLPINVEMVGGLSQLRNFIKSLNDFSGRFITIDQIQWNKKGEGIFLLSLGGKAYFYPLPSTLGSIDSPLPKIERIGENILARISQIQLVSESESDLDKITVGKKDLFQ